MIDYKNPKKVLINLTKRYLKQNKLLNYFAILAIILTCILFTCLFNVFMTINSSIKEQAIEESGTRYSGSFDYLTFDEIETLNQSKYIKKSDYINNLGNVENIELNKNFSTTIFYFSPECFEEYRSIKINNMVGKYPEKNNEVMLSTTVLKQLGIASKIGEDIELNISFQDHLFKEKFVLSGYYEYNKFEDLQYVFLSDNFKNTTNIYNGQSIFFLLVDLKNNLNLAEKFEDIINESGYNKNENERITYSINPAYSKFLFMDIGTLSIIFLFVIFIILSGYLIIYNIFNISILNQVKFYGLLNTVGFTSKQIKAFILKQGLYLTGIALPIGMLLGYLIGNILLSYVMKITEINLQINPNIYIFIFSGLFTAITVYLSLISPAKHANKLSSIDAVKVNGTSISRRGNINKKLTIVHLAKLNILKNRKQFGILILSLSLMPILLNLVITFVSSFDYDRYMSRFVTSDFVVAHYNYFNSKYDSNSVVDDKLINYIDNMDIVESGAIYCDKVYGRSYEGNSFERVREDVFSTKYNNTEYDIEMYGYDEFPLSKFEVINGKLDNDLLKTGNYIIEIIEVDDYNQPDFNTMRFKVGDRIDLYYNNEYVKTVTVLAQVKKIQAYAELVGTLDFIAELALPSEEYLKLAPIPHKMSYVFNVPQTELNKIDIKLTEYISNVNESMKFKSKLDYKKQYHEAKNSFLIPGIFGAILVGFIGIFNFINVIITSIISRKEEFIVLNKIGMTGNQLKNMLLVEEILYTFFSSITFVILSCIVNLSALKYIIDHLWLTKYHFNFISLFACIPIYLIISLVIPLIVKKISINKI
ncbi:MAG: FtsX-like permease family protein [Anaerocolumna sp.]